MKQENKMWEPGFESSLKEILIYFNGEISYKPKNFPYKLSIVLEDGGVLVRVKDHQTYVEKLSFRELYSILVPDNKLTYFYMFEDLLYEIREKSPKIMIDRYLEKMMVAMYPTLVKRKDQMEKEEIKLIPGFRFKLYGRDFEQMAFSFS